METIDLIKQELEKGKVVYRDIEGLHSVSLEEFVNQPADGILYDLNRNEAVILQFIDDPKWVNDFACAQVIRYLKKELDDFKKNVYNMKTKDLRLGNYVTDHSGFTMYVVGIYEDTVLLNFEGNEGDVWEVDEKDLKPIALDKEMLLKLGYKIYVSDNGWDRYSKKGIDFHLSPLISGGYIPSFHINGEYHIIKYLHELQNLFYMLKNEELTINL